MIEMQFGDGQSSKGNNSKSINARVMVLALCTYSNAIYFFVKKWEAFAHFSAQLYPTLTGFKRLFLHQWVQHIRL